MQPNQCRELIVNKGGRILENRKVCKGVSVGDKFTIQSLKNTYEVLFFFKDAIFDTYPMICGYCWETKNPIFCATTLITVKKEEIIKRKRRIQ